MLCLVQQFMWKIPTSVPVYSVNPLARWWRWRMMITLSFSGMDTAAFLLWQIGLSRSAHWKVVIKKQGYSYILMHTCRVLYCSELTKALEFIFLHYCGCNLSSTSKVTNRLKRVERRSVKTSRLVKALAASHTQRCRLKGCYAEVRQGILSALDWWIDLQKRSHTSSHQ